MAETPSPVLDRAPRRTGAGRCPSCGAPDPAPFYTARDLPVHSCLLVPTREEAVAFPRGDLRLAHCGACGFVANPLFDPEVHRYSSRYEETQGFSGRFREFLASLARRLVEAHRLQGRTLLEIGCGKGEFAALLAELGDMTGVGIDPAYVPERGPAGAEGRIDFVRDFWDEGYAHLAAGADLVCCRHTLEHIAPVGTFLRALRAAIGDRTDTILFLEVPDLLRQLREGAFWDVYYEHCSYFSPGSLARLVRAAGFELLDLELDFDDQYVLLTARPAGAPTRPRLPLEDDREELALLVRAFPGVVGGALRGWRDRIHGILRDGGRIAVWGAGSKCVAFLTTLGLSGEIAGVVDVNPVKQGCFLPGTGHEVLSPETLARTRPSHVIVMNPVYVAEIGRDLSRLGLGAEVLPL